MLVVMAFLGALPARPEAQVRVEGVLFDSLRTQGPVASAEIVLMGSGRRTLTDRAGRFAFDGVPPGSHTFAFWAPWLDSLSLPALQRAVEVPPASRGIVVNLSTPSVATYQRAVCGTTIGADGVLVGEVRSAAGDAVEGLSVLARWRETTLGTGTHSVRIVGAADTTTASGSFALCGVPRDEDVTLVAGDSARGSGEVIVRFPGSVGRRDLVASPGTDRTRLVGRIVEGSGAGVAGVRVVAVGDSAWQATTDSSGRYTIERFPRRSAQLVVRAIGFEPAMIGVEPRDERTELGTTTLSKVPFELSRVTVDGRVLSREELEFEHRRRIGTGHFVSEDEIRRVPTFTPQALFSFVPRSRLRCNPRGDCQFAIPRGNELCLPRIFVDGHAVTGGKPADAGDQQYWLQRAKRVEVHRAALAPPQFTDFEGCGALVIWTR
jgi:hypothetical protein